MGKFVKKALSLKNSNNAVSEVLGTILLLGFAVAIFSVLYVTVLSETFHTNPPSPTIVATIIEDNIVFEHRGGDSLDFDDVFNITIDDESQTITVGDYLEDTNGDGKWNVGEKLEVEFDFSLSYNEADVFGVDIEGNKMILSGTLDIAPENDLGLKIIVDNLNPTIGDDIYITIIVTNFKGDIDATGVQVKFLLPAGLKYKDHNPPNNTDSEYNEVTGIWKILKPIPIRESASIVIQAEVLGTVGFSEPTQLGIILDGSSSISVGDWNLMRTGLANALKNESVFPYDGSVELSIVQFGGANPPRAQSELGGPIVVDETNNVTIADNIELIEQMVNDYWWGRLGYTPMGCGIRKISDQIFEDGNFSIDKRQIICLVTDGRANCMWTEEYNATHFDTSNWYNDTTHSNNGLYSARSEAGTFFNPLDGYFRSNYLDAAGAGSITVKFWYYLEDTENNDLTLQYFNGEDWNTIIDLGGDTEDTWIEYTDIITETQYFKSDFRIGFYSSLEGTDNVWIDDVFIETDIVLLDDSFEGASWNRNWELGKYSTEWAQTQIIDILEMTDDTDEFNSIVIGDEPDIPWLKNYIVWPQPGYEAPPFDNGPGWISQIDSFNEFEAAMNQLFKIIFSSILNTVEVINLDSNDPNPENNIFHVTIVPTEP